MEREHEIVELVCAARESSLAADELVRKYLPFIRAQTAKHLRRPARDSDDELSIAMMAFHEAVLAYERRRGSFLGLAARAIQNRLIDHFRAEQRHMGHLSLHETQGEDDRTLAETLDVGEDPIEDHTDRTATRQELLHYSVTLSRYGLSLTDIAESCPKQDRTLAACHRALRFARQEPGLLEQVERTGRLPIARLAVGANAERKTLERHRDYLLGLLLAYTNGFEILRGHLGQLAIEKGGR